MEREEQRQAPHPPGPAAGPGSGFRVAHGGLLRSRQRGDAAGLRQLCRPCSPSTATKWVLPVSRIHSHCVFVDKVRIPASVSTYGRFAFLFELFEEWGINTLTFSPGLTDDELTRTLVLLARSRSERDGRPRRPCSTAQGIAGGRRPRWCRRAAGGSPGSLTPRDGYSAPCSWELSWARPTGPIEPGTIRRARHVTQAVVDEILRDPTSLLTLTTIKDFDNYLILHSTNVAVLSTVLGQRLGLDKATLGELCLAGFLHDAGKLGVDPDVLNKPGARRARNGSRCAATLFWRPNPLLNERRSRRPPTCARSSSPSSITSTTT